MTDPDPTTDVSDGDTPAKHRQGEFLGTFDGLVVRGTTEDGFPVIEIHGEDGMAAFRATDATISEFLEAADQLSIAVADDIVSFADEHGETEDTNE